jgi:hypothetical protein
VLDIDLLAERAPFAGVVIYRYKTGFLRPAVLQLIEELSGRAGTMYSAYEVSDLVRRWNEAEAETFFPGIRVCDLGEPRLAHRGFGKLKPLFSVEAGQPTIIMLPFAKYNDGFHPGALVVDEPVVTERNILRLLQYVANNTDLPGAIQFYSQIAFQTYFRKWIEVEGRAYLPKLIEEFENAILLYSEPGSGVFCSPRRDEAGPPTRSFLVSALNRYLRHQGADTRAGLLRAISVRRVRGYADHTIISDLVVASRNVVEKVGQQTRGHHVATPSAEASPEAVLLWGALILAWDRKNACGSVGSGDRRLPLPIAVEHLCHDFEARVSDLVCDPLVEVWSDLADISPVQPLSGDEELVVRPAEDLHRVLEGAARRTSSNWGLKLYRLLSTGSVVQSHAFIAGTRETRASRSFDDVIGQEHILAEVRKRFADDCHTRPLILIGPPGSGGKMVARLYARALLCEDKTPDSIHPCGACSVCRVGGFGYAELDLSHPDILNQSKSTVDRFRFQGFSDRRAVILKNADHADEALDIFLKTMEEKNTNTTYIVLARDEKHIRAAALSRSARFHLRRVSEFQACSLARRWLRADQDIDQVARLISLHGDHRPGIMWHLAQLIKRYEAVSLSQARSLFGLDWGERSVRYFEAVFGGRCDDAIKLLRTIDVDPRRAAAKLRQFLGLMTGDWYSDAAFVGLDEDVHQLARSCAAAAAKVEIERQRLWERLAHYWLEDRVYDGASLEEAGYVTQSIVSGFLPRD